MICNSGTEDDQGSPSLIFQFRKIRCGITPEEDVGLVLRQPSSTGNVMILSEETFEELLEIFNKKSAIFVLRAQTNKILVITEILIVNLLLLPEPTPQQPSLLERGTFTHHKGLVN